MQATNKTYGGRAVGLLVYLPLGLWCLAILVVTPILLTENFWLWMICVEPPLAAVTLLVLSNSYAAWASRIEIHDDRLVVHAPQWRATPLPPVTRLDVPWSAVRALRHRTEIYNLLPGIFPFPVPVYAIDTAEGRAVFGGRYGLKLDRTLRTIATRSGLAVTEEGDTQANLFTSLIHGAPGWGGG